MGSGGGKVSVKNNPISKAVGDVAESLTGKRSIGDAKLDGSGGQSSDKRRGLARGSGHQDQYDEIVNSMPTYADSVKYEGLDKNQLSGYDVASMGAQQGYNIDSLDPDAMRGYSVDSRQYQELGDLQDQDAMNFDPYRRNAMQDIDASVASGQATAEGAMARSGGLSAADRMAMASEFNRNKIQGRQGSLGKYDEMEAQNRYQTNLANAKTANDAAYWGADQRVANEAARSGEQNTQNAYLAGQQNLALTTNAAAQTAANKFKSGQQYDADLYNAMAGTEANKYMSDQQNNLYTTDVANRNTYNQNAYDASMEEWKNKGKVHSGA